MRLDIGWTGLAASAQRTGINTEAKLCSPGEEGLLRGSAIFSVLAAGWPIMKIALQQRRAHWRRCADWGLWLSRRTWQVAIGSSVSSSATAQPGEHRADAADLAIDPLAAAYQGAQWATGMPLGSP